ncbi:hypothetical protein [Daejeonella lutea]|uniref:Uncharacterized protein n=1 Tax=Daejeonella lutea TaxID=572036 RepID=A0A1T5DKF6_9SPHI|nr:hypothetical protein [Daejeonella lutea]SKB72189.1 hypothetical protein SAMN05661099_2387 [Daejeonella lutea]
MRPKIENIQDLRTELSRLRSERLIQEIELTKVTARIKARLHFPVLVYNKISDFFIEMFGDDPEDLNKTDNKDKDWVTNIFRVGLPVALNKFLFPRSGFLMKSIVALVSQKAAKNVNKDSITELIDKVTDWIKTPRPKTRKEPVLADYGIPPDSETY